MQHQPSALYKEGGAGRILGLTIMSSCGVTLLPRGCSGKGVTATAGTACFATGNSSRSVTAAWRSRTGWYWVISTKTAWLLQEMGRQVKILESKELCGGWDRGTCKPASVSHLGLPCPHHPPVADPVVLLEALQTGVAFSESRSQFLDVAPAVIDGKVAPVPGPEIQGRRRVPQVTGGWKSPFCAPQDPALAHFQLFVNLSNHDKLKRLWTVFA